MTSKKELTGETIRVKTETKIITTKLLKQANSKKIGRTVKPNDLINLALGLVTKEHIKTLQKQSFSFEDQKEIWRSIHIKKIGQISKDNFTGFMMNSEFLKFTEKFKEDFEKSI
jgi:hypothetical protein